MKSADEPNGRSQSHAATDTCVTGNRQTLRSAQTQTISILVTTKLSPNLHLPDLMELEAPFEARRRPAPRPAKTALNILKRDSRLLVLRSARSTVLQARTHTRPSDAPLGPAVPCLGGMVPFNDLNLKKQGCWVTFPTKTADGRVVRY